MREPHAPLRNSDFVLLDQAPRRPRLAAGLIHAYPAAELGKFVAVVEEVAGLVGMDLAWFHWAVPDPRTLPADLRARLGGQLAVPTWPGAFRSDEAHFVHTLPEHHARVRADLERWATPATSPPREFAVGMAFSVARWLRAWRADAVLTFFGQTPSLAGAVASSLLEIPHVQWMFDPKSADVPIWSAPELRRWTWFSVPNEGMRELVRVHVGEDVAARTVPRLGGRNEMPEVAPILRRAIAERSPQAPARGPRVAFAVRPQPLPEARRARLFVIVGAERTGSNLLVSLLGGQSGVACAGELFNPRLIREDILPWVPQWPRPGAAEQRWRVEDPARFLDLLRTEGAARGAEWVGCKVLYGHAVLDNRIVDALLADPSTVILHLRRRDHLARYLSLRRAQASDAWVSGKVAADERMVVQAADVALDFTQVALFEQRFAATFAGHRVLELTYEDLASDRGGQLERIGAALERSFRPVATDLKKTGHRQACDGVANLEELRAALQGTRWERFVAEPAQRQQRQDARPQVSRPSGGEATA
jgi:LPS sulfotransferase NodH